jgi:DNA-binding NarL/FixJ family response regulator
MTYTIELNAQRGSFVQARGSHDVAPMWAVRTLLVGGHTIFRRGLRELLERAGFRVIGEAASAMRGLGEHRPAASILVLTSSASGTAIAEAVAAGACGYLLKTASPGELVLEIQAAVVAKALVLPREAAEMVERCAPAPGMEHQPSLSARELEVLRLVAQGRDNGEIATTLFISPSTAKTHVSHILKKLRSTNRIQAAVYAAKCGLV